MKNLSAVIHDLTRREIRFVKQFFEANLFRKEGEENKAIQLLDLIIRKPAISQREASRILYSDPGSKAFSILKSKMVDLICILREVDQLILQRKGFWQEDWMRNEWEIQRLVATGSFMRKRRQKELSTFAFKKALRKADAEQFPSLRMESASGLIKAGSADSIEELDDQLAEFDKGLSLYRLETRVNYVLRRFSLIQQGKAMNIEGRKFLGKWVPILEAEFGGMYHPKARYSYLKLKAYFLQDKGLIDEARRAIEEMIEITSDPSWKGDPMRKGIAWYQMMRIEMLANRLEEAEVAANHAMEIFPENHENRLIHSLFLVYILIHSGKLEDAKTRLNSMEERILVHPQSEVIITFKYHHACIAFLERDFSTALRIIRSTENLLTEKPGWAAGFKVFELMSLIELQEYDLATYRIEALRKSLGRKGNNGRLKTIQLILSNLERNAFEFKAFSKEKELMDRLTVDHPWSIGGHETIRFDQWYRHKRFPEKREWESICRVTPEVNAR